MIRVRQAFRAATCLAAMALAACGGEPDDERTPGDSVREAASAYLSALEDGSWARACGMLTSTARSELKGTGGSCPRTLASGSALTGAELASAARQVAGAPVRVRGARATLGPLGALPEPLRLKRVGGRWLVAG